MAHGRRKKNSGETVLRLSGDEKLKRDVQGDKDAGR